MYSWIVSSLCCCNVSSLFLTVIQFCARQLGSYVSTDRFFFCVAVSTHSPSIYLVTPLLRTSEIKLSNVTKQSRDWFYLTSRSALLRVTIHWPIPGCNMFQESRRSIHETKGSRIDNHPMLLYLDLGTSRIAVDKYSHLVPSQ